MTRDDELRLEQMNAGASGNAEAVTEVRGVGAAPSGKSFLQHLNESAKRALNPIRSKSPVAPGQRKDGRGLNHGSGSDSAPVAGAIACPDCATKVENVPDLKKHMSSAHGGFNDMDIQAATSPESTVPVKVSVLHTALKAHAALAKEVGADKEKK